MLCIQGKHVQGNQEGTADVKKIRTWRQYMNRYVILSLVVRTFFDDGASSCTDVEASTDHWTRSNDGFMAISTRTSDGQLVECIRCFDHATDYSGYPTCAQKTNSALLRTIYIHPLIVQTCVSGLCACCRALVLFCSPHRRVIDYTICLSSHCVPFACACLKQRNRSIGKV